MGDLYDKDVVEWSEQQARLLRQHAAGDPSNEPPDWINIIEEIESVGNEQRFAWQSLTLQVLLHDLKAEAWPTTPYVDHWRADARLFRAQARDRWTNSMRHKVNLGKLYRDALHAMPDTVDGLPQLPVPTTCPMTLDDLLTEEP